MKWVSFLSIFILMITFSFVLFTTSVHALTVNDVISWIFSGFTSQPSTGAIQGSVGGGGSSTITQIQCDGLAGIQCPADYYCKIPEGCSDCYGVCTPISNNSIFCNSDYDCRNLVCTAVICHDTPRCLSNKCVCGSGSSCLTTTTAPSVCTHDVKQCPDGAYVERNRNDNCNFFPCPISPCPPICKAIGTRSEGWYDSCTGKLIIYANCGETTTTTTISKPSCPYDCCNSDDSNYQSKLCFPPECPAGVPCPIPMCLNHQCIASPIQLLSVQTIPANPQVGDRLNFNVTFENVGNAPIYYMRGAGVSSLSVSYSPTGFFGRDGIVACPQYVQLINLQPNQIDSVGLDCANSNSKLIETGTLNANLKLSWGYDPNNLNNSISFSNAVTVSPSTTTTSTTTTTPILCTNDFDCPSEMKCTNYICPECRTGAACAPCRPNYCVDVGCVPEGGVIPGGSISPESIKHMATICCNGLQSIPWFGYYDDNCNFVMNVGGPSGVCSKCGNGICESWETKCNCPQDCGGITTTTTTIVPSGCTGPITSNCKTDQDCQNQITPTSTCVQGQPCNPAVVKCYNNNCYLCTNKQPCPYDCCVGDSQYQDKTCPVFQPPCPNRVNCAQQQNCVNHKCIPSATSYTVNFKSGWNLFSVPVKNVFAVSSTTCSPATPIYGFSNGNYYQATYTSGGNGYWVKMNSDCSETLTGTGVTLNDFPTLSQGWNLIGAPSTSTIFADIVGNCNVVSGPFWYNPATNSYIQSSTLDSSKGYFVKVSANCQLGAGLPPLPPQ